MPDEKTILKFRRLLETHRLSAALFAETAALLAVNGFLLKGKMVDATMIAAPP